MKNLIILFFAMLPFMVVGQQVLQDTVIITVVNDSTYLETVVMSSGNHGINGFDGYNVTLTRHVTENEAMLALGMKIYTNNLGYVQLQNKEVYIGNEKDVLLNQALEWLEVLNAIAAAKDPPEGPYTLQQVINYIENN